RDWSSDVVSTRYPLWTDPQERARVVGMRDDRREALVTTVLDAAPQHRYVLPASSIWPFLTAAGLTIGLICAVFYFSGYWLATLFGLIGFIGWFWPRRPVEVEP